MTISRQFDWDDWDEFEIEDEDEFEDDEDEIERKLAEFGFDADDGWADADDDWGTDWGDDDDW